MASRRKFLSILGGGVVVAAAAGGGWAATRDPAGARRPWETAGRGETDIRRKALSYAVLAPNPHNRQPWIADLSGADEVTLYCDPERRLPHTDPFDRQTTIGLGCFLELLVQAAAEHGNRADMALFPEGEPQPRLDGRPLARVRFTVDGSALRDPLFAYVHDRRSNKEPYDTARAVGGGLLRQIASAARANPVAHTNEPAHVATLRSRAWEAMHTEVTTPATLKESIDLMRIGRAEIEAKPDGIALSGALVEALALTGMLTREAMLDMQSAAFQQQVEMLKAPFDTAMAFLWLTTHGNSRVDQISAGRGYVRMNLAATGLGVAMQPFSQALQEFTEMRPHYTAMRSVLGIPETDTLQMFARLGYGPALSGSPRWPYETRISST